MFDVCITCIRVHHVYTCVCTYLASSTLNENIRQMAMQSCVMW